MGKPPGEFDSADSGRRLSPGRYPPWLVRLPRGCVYFIFLTILAKLRLLVCVCVQGCFSFSLYSNPGSKDALGQNVIIDSWQLMNRPSVADDEPQRGWGVAIFIFTYSSSVIGLPQFPGKKNEFCHRGTAAAQLPSRMVRRAGLTCQ